MPEPRMISKQELKEWYETKTPKEVVEHFGFKHLRTLYRILDKAGIPRNRPITPIELVD